MDPYDIYEEIIKQNLTYPNYLKDKKAKKLITQLLDKVPEIRLGESYDALKAHAWFENFDWHKLIEKELKAPFIPSPEKYVSEQEIREQERSHTLLKDEMQVHTYKVRVIERTEPEGGTVRPGGRHGKQELG